MDDFLGSLKLLTFRAKIALPLIYSQHVLNKKDYSAEDIFAIEKSFDLAWQWLEDQSITAYDLYLSIQPLHIISQKQANVVALNALLSSISALYYATWKADGYDFTDLKRDNRALYGGDLFEISDEAALEAKTLAIEAASDPKSENEWQEKKLIYMIKHYTAVILGELGPKLSKKHLLQ